MISQPRYKNRAKLFFLCFFAFLGIALNAASLNAAVIELETIPFTDPEDKDCNLGTMQKESIESKWWKPLLDAVGDAAVEVGNATFDGAKDGVAKFMLVGFGLWLAIFTLKVVSNLQESDPMENLTKVGAMMFKVGLSYAFLMNRDEFFSFLSIVTNSAASYVGAGTTSGGGLSDVISPLFSMAEDIHGAASKFDGKGDFIKCIANIHTIKLFDFPMIALTDASVFASGCLLSVGGFILKLLFPFFMFEVMVRVGITAALCPLFLAAWPFPSTTAFTKKGFDALLNVAFTLMFLSLCMELGLALLEDVAGVELESGGDDAKRIAVCKLRLWRWGDAVSCEGNSGSSIKDMFFSMLMFLAALFYVFQLLASASSYANYYSGASFSGDPAIKALGYAVKKVSNGLTRGVNALSRKGVKKFGGKDFETLEEQQAKENARFDYPEESGSGAGPAAENPNTPKDQKPPSGSGDPSSSGGQGASPSGNGDASSGGANKMKVDVKNPDRPNSAVSTPETKAQRNQRAELEGGGVDQRSEAAKNAPDNKVSPTGEAPKGMSGTGNGQQNGKGGEPVVRSPEDRKDLQQLNQMTSSFSTKNLSSEDQKDLKQMVNDHYENKVNTALDKGDQAGANAALDKGNAVLSKEKTPQDKNLEAEAFSVLKDDIKSGKAATADYKGEADQARAEAQAIYAKQGGQLSGDPKADQLMAKAENLDKKDFARRVLTGDVPVIDRMNARTAEQSSAKSGSDNSGAFNSSSRKS